MKCHYEVLEIERNATNDEIKKAYRKLALKWHPDKNVGNEEEATARFKEVTAAQTVLSDPHERKWYDDHREAILRGGSGTAHGGGEDDGSPVVNLWPFFNSGCFSGFDGPEGFYAVYGKLFEEIHATECHDDSAKTDSKFTPFGNESSSQKEVFLFYSHWSNFVSQLTFSWADEYNTLEAPNRQIKRAMEKENKKKRDAARKKYVDSVRALVEYVKKRDVRYIRFEKEVRKRREEEEAERTRKAVARKELKTKQQKILTEQMREELEHEELRRDEERKGAFLLADLSDDEWVHHVNGGNEGLMEEDDVESSSANEEHDFRCEICNKEFKSDIQQKQHFASKVHRKKAQDIAKKEKNKKRGKYIADEVSNDVSKSLECVSEVEREPVVRQNDSVFAFGNELGARKSEDEHNGKSDGPAYSSKLPNLEAINLQGPRSDDSSTKNENDINRNEVKSIGNSCGLEYEIITPGGGYNENTVQQGSSNDRVKSKGKEKVNMDARESDHNSSSARNTTICQICGFDAQGSRNKLFQHIKDFGHAAYKDDLSLDGRDVPHQTVQKISKKEKKKMKTGKGTHVRRNDYRL